MAQHLTREELEQVRAFLVEVKSTFGEGVFWSTVGVHLSRQGKLRVAHPHPDHLAAAELERGFLQLRTQLGSAVFIVAVAKLGAEAGIFIIDRVQGRPLYIPEEHPHLEKLMDYLHLHHRH
jgi:hypothetical protein